MGTFEAIRRSLAETAGAGAALRTMTAGSTRRQPQPGISDNGHIDHEDDQLQLFRAGRGPIARCRATRASRTDPAFVCPGSSCAQSQPTRVARGQSVPCGGSSELAALCGTQMG